MLHRPFSQPAAVHGYSRCWHHAACRERSPRPHMQGGEGDDNANLALKLLVTRNTSGAGAGDLSFGPGVGTISAPRLAIPNADFVREEEAIPAVQASPVTAATLRPCNIKVMVMATWELLSNPSAEGPAQSHVDREHRPGTGQGAVLCS